MSALESALDCALRFPPARRLISRLVTNHSSSAIHARPRPFSLWSHLDEADKLNAPSEAVGDYTTWPMLTDKQFSKRYLPPASKAYIDSLPADTTNTANQQLGDITQLFMRQGDQTPSRSSALFTFFAQWFTDSVLRIDPRDRRKNTSNHNIDLCQIYGLTEATARILRRNDGSGKLRSQLIDGEEWPDYLGFIDENNTWQAKPHYQELPYVKDQALFENIFKQWSPQRRAKIYATGLERGNSSIGYITVSTLFLREHNRLCDCLAAQFQDWDDERLFQTARMINTVILMKLVIEDYINHIAGRQIFMFDPSYAEKQEWYRTPWVAVEFDLLYRWHGLIPDTVAVADQQYGADQFMGNNALLESAGLAAMLEGVSATAAGAISLKNSPYWMAEAEYQMIKMGRGFRLQSYNDYRKAFKLSPLNSFQALTDDIDLQNRLQSLYQNVDQLEFIVGLFAEKAPPNRLFGDLMNQMVAYDAFTQIYTNPLLSKHVYNAQTLSPLGLSIIDATDSIQTLAARNCAQQLTRVSLDFIG